VARDGAARVATTGDRATETEPDPAAPSGQRWAGVGRGLDLHPAKLLRTRVVDGPVSAHPPHGGVCQRGSQSEHRSQTQSSAPAWLARWAAGRRRLGGLSASLPRPPTPGLSGRPRSNPPYGTRVHQAAPTPGPLPPQNLSLFQIRSVACPGHSCLYRSLPSRHSSRITYSATLTQCLFEHLFRF